MFCFELLANLDGKEPANTLYNRSKNGWFVVVVESFRNCFVSFRQILGISEATWWLAEDVLLSI